ncbi:hemoglobin-like flavoprotein [Paraburkholderia atlantica]|uniref:hypothetical protein n=1 Tax=Paraburkholderia atlantica TaxID=2654982 RepID=UPI003D1FB358
MSASLSPETISIIKSTAPVMQKHGVAITTRMGGAAGERILNAWGEAYWFLADEGQSDTSRQSKRLTYRMNKTNG